MRTQGHRQCPKTPPDAQGRHPSPSNQPGKDQHNPRASSPSPDLAPQSRFKELIEVRESSASLITSLKVLKASITQLGNDAPALRNNREGLARTVATLGEYHLDYQRVPHDTNAFELLKTSISNVSRTLCCLYSSDSSKLQATAKLLGLDIIQLESATKRFLTYDPRQAGFYFDVNSNPAAPNSPLNINYRVLNSIANNPEAFVFDLDDCLIMSERAHKKAWNAALKLWAADIHRQGGQTLQPSTVAKLCRTVDYCLAKDQTHGLLSLLCRICERHGFLIEQGEHGTPERALESSLARFRAEALCDSLTRREITFAPGSTDLLSHAFLDGKKLGLFTNSPQVIVDKLLLKLDELNPEVGINELLPTCARVYGDTTAHRKPFPLGWLEVAKQLNCRPDQVMIFDNSLVNCDAASELSRYCTHSDVVAAMKDRTASQNFAAVVGITNSDHCNLSLWRNWSANPGKTVRVTVDALSRIIVA